MARVVRPLGGGAALAVLVLALFSRAHSEPAIDPLSTAPAGIAGPVATSSVFRIVVPSKGASATGFLHKSGRLITAAHAVLGCLPRDVFFLDSLGRRHGIDEISCDVHFDLAILKPHESIAAPALPLSMANGLDAGQMVETWGFPAGYTGALPLLTVGYCSGVDLMPALDTGVTAQWVVDAAFNHGSSGGPLVEEDSGTVVGVVARTIAPLPTDILNAIGALKANDSGWACEYTGPDGAKKRMTEAQVVAHVLEYMLSQTQLGMGTAIMMPALRQFLRTQGIEP